jgi:hypothetical protein
MVLPRDRSTGNNKTGSGRRYLATIHRDNNRLVICDLSAGKVAADWPIPSPNRLAFKVPWALTFSQDGRSLSLMYDCGLDIYLATWDLRTSHGSTRKVRGLGDVGNPILSGMTNTGPLLEGLSDGKVLIAGHALVDPQSGAVVRKLPEPSFQGDVRRVFGSKWARITGAEGARHLTLQPFPPP